MTDLLRHLVLLSRGLLGVSTAALASPILDQQNLVVNGGFEPSAGDLWQQGVTAGLAGTLVQVHVNATLGRTT